MSARDRIAFAADLPLSEALALYPKLSPHVGWVKVGLSLFVEHGPRAVQPFLDQGARVFLDLKLHDIPNTVELAAARAGALGVGLLTIHASGGEAMVRAAVAGAKAGAEKAGRTPPKILAVTVLTSLDAESLWAMGWEGSPSDTAERLGRLAVKAGAEGLVCSPAEAARLRKSLGPGVFLCTPGVRPAGAESQDQARAQTPAFAARAGSDLLVVGRPLSTAADPLNVARALESEVAAAIA